MRCGVPLTSRIKRVTFRLYDTATREVRDFVPLEEGKAGLYVCGLTVQSEPHVGHVRSGVDFDVLQRWLRHLGYDVTFIRNVTDIDDKILVRSEEHTSELQSRRDLVCRLLLEKKKIRIHPRYKH